MVYQFAPATKEKAHLRLALFGPSGSGKTFTALRLATGLGGEIAVIDTERGSASKYADRFNFSVLELPPTDRDIVAYCTAIKAAEKANFDVLILDSLTHAWRELLDEVDKLARSRYGGNRWSAWSDGTPLQNRLVDTILGFPGHVIATMRTKTEWTVTTDDKGKVKPVRLGLEPEQGKGIEYEFDLLMELTIDHIATVTKDRTGRYQDQAIEMPGEDLGAALAEWLAEGVEPRPRPEVPLKPRSAEPPARIGKDPSELIAKGKSAELPHWIDRVDKNGRPVKGRFWEMCGELGLDDTAVYAALKVEHIHDYTGTMDEAKALLDAAAKTTTDGVPA